MKLIKNKSSKPGHAVLRYSLHLSGTPSLYMTDANMYLYILQKIWSDINWVNLHQPVRLKGIPAMIKEQNDKERRR